MKNLFGEKNLIRPLIWHREGYYQQKVRKVIKSNKQFQIVTKVKSYRNTKQHIVFVFVFVFVFGAAPFSRGILNILDLYEKSPRGYFVRPAAYKVHYF